MPGASRDVLPIFIFCLCQLVTGVSTQAISGHGNSLSGSQKQIPIDVGGLRYDDDTSVDVVDRFLDGVPYLVPLSGSKDKLKRGGKFSGHGDRQAMADKSTVTSPSNRNTETRDAVVSEGGRRRQVHTTASSADSTSRLTSHPPETSSPNRRNAGRTGVSGKRLNIDLQVSRSRGGPLITTVLPTSRTQKTGTSREAPYSNLPELLDTDLNSVSETDLVSFDNETDLVSFVNDSDSVNFVNETDLDSIGQAETVTDNRQKDNSTVLRPVAESSLQLSHTKTVVTFQKDKADRRNAGYVKDSRQSNTSNTPTVLEPRPVSRQPITNNTPTVLEPRPISRQPITNNTSTVLEPRPVSRQPITNNTPTVLEPRQVSRQPVTNNTPTVLEPRPVSRQPITNNTPTTLDPRPASRHHNSLPSTPAEPPEFLDSAWEEDSSASKRTASSAEPATEAGPADTQTENDGGLENEDPEEDDSNDTSTCTTCNKSGLAEDLVKKMRIAVFKESLAKKLGINLNESSMEGAVNDARSPAVLPKLPPVILEQTIKANAKESEMGQFLARDQEIIMAGEDLGRDCPRTEVTGCYRFHIKDKVKGAVAEAKLWFYKLKDVNDVKGQTFRVIYLNTNNNSRPQQGPVIAAIDDVYIREGWVQMDITGEMHKWLDTGSPVLAIRCPTCRAKSYTSLFGVRQDYKPLLVLKYASQNQVVSRGKRSSSCDPVSECCKRDLVIRFHEIHMPEVYEPHNLSIGYCFGSCVETHQFTYNHTIFRERARLTGASAGNTMSQQLRSCCVPLVLKDAFLMTIEGNEFVLKVVPKVIVETCGCM
ncbi:hypothetical protein BsWGS_18899 [Bradybaena similaris]